MMKGNCQVKGKQIKTNSGSSDFFRKAEESSCLKGKGRECRDGEETRLYFHSEQRKNKFQTQQPSKIVYYFSFLLFVAVYLSYFIKVLNPSLL